MFIKQVSIFIENKKGSISKVLSELGNAGINIRALSVADSTDFGILRLIVDNPEKAYDVIKGKYTGKLTDVLGFAVSDTPNGLGKALSVLDDNNVEITYIYSFVGHYDNQAVGIVKTTNLELTESILKENGVVILGEEIYKN